MQKKELLRKYLAGESTPEEEEALFQLWQHSNSGDEQEVSQALWHAMKSQRIDQERSVRMYQRIEAQINPDSASRHRSHVWRIAAAVSAVLLIATAMFYRFANTSILTVSTAYGATQTLYLPDGSEVIVNGNSRLAYAEDWEEGEAREVWLEGEAYFKVTKQKDRHDARVKFIVHAQDLDIQVLGTEFNVFHREEEVHVLLTEGKVHLQSDQAKLKLDMLPGEMVTYSSKRAAIEKKTVQAQHYIAWTAGKYVFDNLSLQEIGELIAHNYGKKVRFADDSLLQKRMTATIPSTKLPVMLRILEEALHLKVRQQGDSLIVAAVE